jgi:hypothetical protein
VLRLYHGTSTKFLPSIKRHGLRPRGVKDGCYSGKLASDPERVYLTDTYPVQFGLIAKERHGGNLLVLGIEIDEARIEPDTDFTEGGLHHWKAKDGAECLKRTGCCSVVGSVTVDRAWVLDPRMVLEVEQYGQTRIETGFRHDAFRKATEEQLESLLFFCAKKYTVDDGAWCLR